MKRVPILLTILLFACGCRSTVPIHVWQPPKLASAVGKRVVVSAVTGPPEIARPIREQLIASAPNDEGRTTSLIRAETLEPASPIRLVSATDDEPSDLAVAAAARNIGADFLLTGHVIEDRRPRPDPNSESPPNIASDVALGIQYGGAPATHLSQVASKKDPETLKVSWRLLALGDGGEVKGMPVIVDAESMSKRHPDLAFVPDTQQRLISGSVRETHQLFAPWIDRRKIEIAVPYGLPGSREVRRGNAAARAGRWGEAREIWQSVYDRYPIQIAALHNLAIAAAAAQEFSTAKELARRAVRLSPTPLHQTTLIWVELMQRDYHTSFGLADPPEGWHLVRNQNRER